MFYEKNPTATQCVSVDGENFEKLSPPSPSSFHLPHSSSLLYSGDSSSTSTISSTILEKTVGRKAQGDTLVAKVYTPAQLDTIHITTVLETTVCTVLERTEGGKEW